MSLAIHSLRICTCKFLNHLTCLVQIATRAIIARGIQQLKDMTNSASAVGEDTVPT